MKTSRSTCTKLLVLLIMAIQPYRVTLAVGGDKGGNGGNVGVCFSDSNIVKSIKENENRISNSQIQYITSVMPLDLYEARAIHNVEIPDENLVLPQMGESPESYVNRIADRFEFLPILVTTMKDKLKQLNYRKYYTEGGLDRIYDTNETYYLDPEKCVIATAIRQSSTSGQVTLEFDNRLYEYNKGSAASYVSQGVLMLHETILRWALDRGQVDAKNARELTAVLIQKKLSRKELIEKLYQYSFLNGNAGLGETPELAFIKRALEEMQHFKINDNLPLNYLEDLKLYAVMEMSSLIMRELLFSYTAFKIEKLPYKCGDEITDDSLNALKENIRSKQEQIIELQKKLASAILGKKKIQAEIDWRMEHINIFKKKLLDAEAADAQWEKCQLEFTNFKVKYQTDIEKAIESNFPLVEAISEKNLLLLEKKSWLRDEYRSLMAERILECKNEILLAKYPLIRKCSSVGMAFTATWDDDPSAGE